MSDDVIQRLRRALYIFFRIITFWLFSLWPIGYWRPGLAGNCPSADLLRSSSAFLARQPAAGAGIGQRNALRRTRRLCPMAHGRMLCPLGFRLCLSQSL